MIIFQFLWIGLGAFLNRIRGGLFDFSGNKLLFPLFLAIICGNIETMICVFIAAYVGQQFGWGTYIGALYGSIPTQEEVPQIDEIVNSIYISLKGKKIYLSEYPRLWGFMALGLRGLVWSFFIGLAIGRLSMMICGIFMPFCYLLTYIIDKRFLKKGGKTAWNLGEWIWGAVITAFMIW